MSMKDFSSFEIIHGPLKYALDKNKLNLKVCTVRLHLCK